MKITDSLISKVMAELGKRGNRAGKSLGGKKAAANMTPEERTVRAKKAAAASAEKRRLQTQ